jgi:hypothetical protein
MRLGGRAPWSLQCPSTGSRIPPAESLASLKKTVTHFLQRIWEYSAATPGLTPREGKRRTSLRARNQ